MAGKENQNGIRKGMFTNGNPHKPEFPGVGDSCAKPDPKFPGVGPGWVLRNATYVSSDVNGVGQEEPVITEMPKAV